MSLPNQKKEPSWVDPSEYASVSLDESLHNSEPLEDVVIVDEKLKEKVEQEETTAPGVVPQTEEVVEEAKETIDVSYAKKEARVLDRSVKSQNARVVFFIHDETVLIEGSETFKRITSLRHTFEEVHIILLNYQSPNEQPPILRFFDNVWLYATYSTSWWKLSYDAYKLAEQQLVFSNGFRGDIIVAEDLFLSGIAGWFVADKYKRPIQVHVYEDFFDDEYIESLEHPTFYRWSTHYLLSRVDALRTKTEFQKEAVLEHRSEEKRDVDTLPSFYDLTAWHDFEPTFTLRERYPQFKFIILHISSMHKSSHTNDVLLSASPILRRYPTIGLVVVGNGPLRTHLERQAIALNLQNQIKFEPLLTEIISHLKSANVLIHLSEDGGEDDVLLAAASVKIPIIATKHGMAGKLFVDGKSARLCDFADCACVTESINMYLNENNSRTQYALNAYETIFEKVEQDYSGYIQSYSESIQRSIKKDS